MYVCRFFATRITPENPVHRLIDFPFQANKRIAIIGSILFFMIQVVAYIDNF